MLLRMLSACAPCIGYWINPTAYSGQDQDPSDETIVGCWLAWALRSHCWVAAAVEEGIEQTMATCVDSSQVAVNQRAQSFHIADSLCIVVLHGHQWQWCSRTLSCVCSLWSDPVLECPPLSWTCMPPPFGFVRRWQRIHERRLTPSCSLVACIGMLVACEACSFVFVCETAPRWQNSTTS